MNTTTVQRLSLLVMTLVLCLAALVVAQDAGPDAGAAKALAVRQERVERLMDDLEARFVRLAQSLEATEPQHAKRLIEALHEAKQAGIEERMATVVTLLNESRLDTAGTEQKRVIEDLYKLIAILLREDDDLDARRKEIERLERWRAEVEAIIAREQGHKRESDKVDAKDAVLRDMAAKIAALEGLIGKQQELAGKTGEATQQSPQTLPGMAQPQSDVRKETEKLARELDEIAKPMEPKESGEAAEGEGEKGDGSQAEGSKGEGAQAKGEQAEGSKGEGAQSEGSQAKGSPGEGSQGESSQGEGSQGKSAQSQSSPSGNEPGQPALKRATEAQQAAEKALGGGKGKEAKGQQDKAVKEMKSALDEMKKERDRIARLPPEHFEKMAKDQDDTANRTGDLDKQMSDASKSGGQSGGQPGGQPSGQSGDQSGEQQPGQPQVKQAQENMQKASGDLRQQDPQKASDEQKEAIRKLQEAREEIEKKLAQLRKEMQEDVLAALEARFSQMLERQKPLTLATAALASHYTGQWNRAEALQVATIGVEEQKITEMAQQALDIIREDATTIVFPRIVEQLHADLAAVVGLLQQGRAEPYTVSVQHEIERTLEELIEALRKAQEQKQQQQQQQGQPQEGQQQQPPLVPASAELKLLRLAQLRVNHRTTGFDETRPGEALDPVMQSEVHRIARMQEDVQQIAQDMAEKQR